MFLFLFFFAIDLIRAQSKKLDIKFVKIIFSFVPAMILVCYIALNPISAENHQIMADYLMINFNETCYMSCGLLKK